MKIAFVIQKIAARSGGAERVLIETANEMSRRGHDVVILSHENRGVNPFYKLADGVRHQNLFDRPIEKKAKQKFQRREKFREGLPHVFPLGHVKWQLTHGGFVRELRKYIKKNRPDLLIPFLPAAITPCALAAKGTPTKVVASTHNAPKQDYENVLRWDPNPIDRRLRVKCLDDIDTILVLLPEYKLWYPKQLHHKIITMPNPVVAIDPERLASAHREKLVIGVGRLADVKRFDILIEAWMDIKRKFPDWKVEIYGDGPDKGKLASIISTYALEDTVFLKGTTSSISDVFLRASVLCHPAEYEGFPLAVCEALAHGVPVVGFSDCTGLNSLVQDNVNGVLVDPGVSRVAAFKTTLEQVLPDAARINRLSAGAPASVAQYQPELIYDSWERVVEKYAKRDEYNY